jgi:hypothetical protein
VLGAFDSVDVEFFFEKSVNGRIQGEGKSRRSADSEPTIHIKAARAFSIEVNFAPAQFEGLNRARGINIS